jgi:hypothetical protein
VWNFIYLLSKRYALILLMLYKNNCDITDTRVIFGLVNNYVITWIPLKLITVAGIAVISLRLAGLGRLITKVSTYISLTLYPRRGSRGILGIPPRHPRLK